MSSYTSYRPSGPGGYFLAPSAELRLGSIRKCIVLVNLLLNTSRSQSIYNFSNINLLFLLNFTKSFLLQTFFLYRRLLVIQPTRHVLFFPAFNLFNFQLGSSFLFIDLPFLFWTQSHRIKQFGSFLVLSESSGNLLRLQTIRILARLWRPAIASHA